MQRKGPFHGIQEGFRRYNEKKQLMNQQMLEDQEKRIQSGEKQNDIMEGVGHGLRGKHGNALWMLFDSRKEIAALTKDVIQVRDPNAQSAPNSARQTMTGKAMEGGNELKRI